MKIIRLVLASIIGVGMTFNVYAEPLKKIPYSETDRDIREEVRTQHFFSFSPCI